MPAPIVVEVYSPQPGAEELSVLIAACSRAAAPAECVTSEDRGSDPSLGVAIVRRDGDRARIELGLRGVAGAEWSMRDLTFQPNDDELERYRAIGFAIGTLVAGKREPAEPSAEPAPARSETPSAEPRPPPAPVAPERPPPRAPRPRATWLDTSAGVGLGLIPGPARIGAALRAASELSPGAFFAVAETGYAERLEDAGLRVRWLTLALGLGHPLGPARSRLGLDLRLELVVERLSFSAEEGSRSDAQSRWKPALGAGIDAYWEALPPLGFVLTASTLFDPERSVVRVSGNQVGETPALGVNGFVGLRLRLR